MKKQIVFLVGLSGLMLAANCERPIAPAEKPVVPPPDPVPVVVDPEPLPDPEPSPDLKPTCGSVCGSQKNMGCTVETPEGSSCEEVCLNSFQIPALAWDLESLSSSTVCILP